MGRRNFHGAVVTLADACEADYLITVRCQQCGARRQMHPYRLIGQHKRLTTARLDTVLPGFHCRVCKRNVSVTITCTYQHPGGW